MRRRIGVGWVAALCVATIVSLAGPGLASASQPSAGTKTRVAAIFRNLSTAASSFPESSPTQADYRTLAASYMRAGNEVWAATCPGWILNNDRAGKCESGWRWDGLKTGLQLRVLARTTNEMATAVSAGNVAQANQLQPQITSSQRCSQPTSPGSAGTSGSLNRARLTGWDASAIGPNGTGTSWRSSWAA